MRRSTPIAIAVVLGGGFGAAYIARERSTTVSGRPDEAVPAPGATPPPAATTPSGSAPDPETAPIVAESSQSARAATPVTTPVPTVAGADDPREPLQVVGEHDDDFANSYLRVAERFRGERRDPTGAVALEREILDRFASLTGLEVTTLEVECRTTTCRVRMAERPGTEYQPLQGSGGFQNLVAGFGTVVSTLSEAEDGSTVFEWLLERDAPAAQ